ncbi:hypothetical protein QUA20_22060 [Microcoleus sp. Pol7_A1]|uniref:hypothetical protein n=1 Tax=Microcoleus sp. Pol7_A1 TaxID=2818893 RepID=UPI002FD1BCAC
MYYKSSRSGSHLDHASDSPDRVIYGNSSIVSDRSAVFTNKLKTKGKKMQKAEFFLNSAF